LPKPASLWLSGTSEARGQRLQGGRRGLRLAHRGDDLIAALGKGD